MRYSFIETSGSIYPPCLVPSQVRLVFPNSQRMNRGNTTVKEIVDIARKADFTDIVLLQVGWCRWPAPFAWRC